MGSLVFVHGTGVRDPGYSSTVKLIRNKLQKDAVDYLVQSLESGRSECADAISRCHGSIPYLLVRECDVDCEAESSGIVLYLAGINKHAGFRAAGSNQWKVTAVISFYEQGVVFASKKITSNASRGSEITAPGSNL